MDDAYLGEIRLFAGSFEPAGWKFCDGQLLLISAYSRLWDWVGMTYGGDGETTFAVPDLRGRVPLHAGTGSDGNNYGFAEMGGVEEVTLTTQQTPAHSHTVRVSAAPGTADLPDGRTLATSPVGRAFTTGTPDTALAADVLQPVGGSQPHNNMQPYLALNYIISYDGIAPF